MSRRCIALTAIRDAATFRADWPIRRATATRSESSQLDIQKLLLFVPVLLFSVIAHEYAHGYAALKQGDTTALMLGRLTWNPIKHIDPFMTILLPLVLWFGSQGRMLLGGAKPVPVNPRNYRNFKRGDIIVSLAGVFTNLLVAVACVLLVPVFGLAGRAADGLESSFGILQAMMIIGVHLNMVLIAFNLIPIPPLDGSHVMKYLLPASWSFRYMQLSRYGIIVLIVLLYVTPNVLSMWLFPAQYAGARMLETVDRFILPSSGQWLR
jgi:Zn-dependent protease